MLTTHHSLLLVSWVSKHVGVHRAGMFNLDVKGGWHCYKIDIEHVHHVSPQYLPTSSSHTVLSHHGPFNAEIMKIVDIGIYPLVN